MKPERCIFLLLLVSALLCAGCPAHKSDVERYITDLKSRSSITREMAAQKLSKMGDKALPALPALRIAVVSDKNKKVRRFAARALGNFKEKGAPAIDALCKALYEPESSLRKDAIKALASIGLATLPAMKKMLLQPHVIGRISATSVLGRLGKPALPLLKQALNDQVGRVRYGAIEALKRIGPPALPVVLDAMDDPHDNIRSYVGWVLSKLVVEGLKQQPALEKKTIATLKKALRNKEKKVRMYAVHTAAALGKRAKPLLDALIKALQDPRWFVRKGAAGALGELGKDARKAVPMLAKALHDGTWDVKKQAARALFKVGGPHVVRELLRWRRHPNKRVVAYVLQVIGWMKGRAKRAKRALVSALNSPHQEVRRAAAQSLVWIGTSALPSLLRALKHRKLHVRQAAAWGLGKWPKPNKSIAAALTKALEDKAPRVQYESAHALRRLAPASTAQVKAWKAMLSQSDAKARYKAIRALGSAGRIALDALPSLLSLLKSEDKKTRYLTMDALAWLADVLPVSARRVVVETLQDSDPVLRKKATLVLRWLGHGAWKVMPAIKASIKHGSRRLKRNLIDVLAEMGSYKDNTLSLMELSTENDKDLQLASIKALAKVGPRAVSKRSASKAFLKDVMDVFVRALGDSDKQVRVAGAKAIGEFGSNGAPAANALCKATKDPVALVRREAAASFGWVGEKAKGGLPCVRVLLKDKDRLVRRNAVFALSQLGKGGITPLLSALRGQDRLNKHNAAIALGRMVVTPQRDHEVMVALRTTLTEKRLPKRIKDAIEQAISLRDTDDKPGVFWVPHPRSPTRETFSPQSLHSR
ncbi:MAG TPA: hypothetical protein DCE42_04570 [Myxococcales bacterium]|mgnify:CR=1 FL=1|nr:hypothetical protein [Deltaproteobacteria bacterium]HAA54002.1 hypothetical protein [Myxococcales bacterium]|tara:strand:+ start:3556 stop:6009 length:2454 start_codon:yes stop_codon:yes gene_type:complete